MKTRPPSLRCRRACGLIRAGLAAATLGAAATAAADAPVAIHGQATYVEQETSGFRAPYAGANSLTPAQGRETFDATLYVGARLWSGAEGWLSGEVDQGFGLDDTLGLAAFPSGEAYKVGRRRPYLRLPRAFVRQTLDLGGEPAAVAAGLLQLPGAASRDRLVVTVGKFSVGDVFDTNQYAHDPRADFLNWAAIDAGSFDYAADAWGYTLGAAAEWYAGAWTLRGGAFDLSHVPNGTHLEPGGHQFQMIVELERRHALGGRPGRLLLTGYDSRGRMGLLDEAVARAEATGGPVDVAAVRRFRSRMGAHVTLEQALADDLGLFARAGGAGGNVEAYEFTDIDRSAAAGLSLKGPRWRRPDDTLGVAAILADISAARRRYLGAGGLGILVGDGQLPHPGREQTLESYYSARLAAQLTLTLDYQHVTNPAYNRDRGPLSVYALRLHAEF